MADMYEFQQFGAEWLSTRTEAYLADEMGLGKTCQVIRAAERIYAKDILVICPAIALDVWVREFRVWSGRAIQTRVLDANSDHHSGTVSIISYAMFSLERPVIANLMDHQFDLLVLDEAHYLKTWGSKRTKQILRSDLMAKCDCVWALSGTPVANHNGDLYPILKTVFPDTVKEFSTPRHFEDQFCRVSTYKIKDRHVRTVTGSKNTRMLGARIKGRFLRRKTKDVLPQLPSIRFVVTPLPVGDTRRVKDITEDMRRQLKSNQNLLTQTKTKAYATQRRELGILKNTATLEFLTDMLDADPTLKVVVFFQHPNDVGKVLCQNLESYLPVYVDGSVPRHLRVIAQEQFQTGRSRVFLGQIQACATAITLTAARVAVFAETNSVPADVFQAAKRIHRIGQTNSCLVHVLSAGGMDTRINSALVAKTKEMTKLFL